jgi:hypothetical protein
MDAMVLPFWLGLLPLPSGDQEKNRSVLRRVIDVRVSLHKHFVEHVFVLLNGLVIRNGLYDRLGSLAILLDDRVIDMAAIQTAPAGHPHESRGAFEIHEMVFGHEAAAA